METKIYTYIGHTLYCPKCFRELFDGGRIVSTNKAYCIYCGIDVFIDYERGITTCSEGITHISNISEMPAEITK